MNMTEKKDKDIELEKDREREAIARGGMFPGIELPDFICPCCGKRLNAEFCDYYRVLKGLAVKRAWEIKGDSSGWREKTSTNMKSINEKRRGTDKATEARTVARKKNAAVASKAFLEERRKWQEEAATNPDARRKLRAHIISRMAHGIERAYERMKPLLVNMAHGALFTVGDFKIRGEVSTAEEIMAYVAKTRSLSGKTLYKMNRVMEDGKLVGAIYVHKPSNGLNSASLWVYGIAIPDDIPDVPEEAVKYGGQ